MSSAQENYRQHLEKVPAILQEVNDQLQTIIINLAMSGESSEIDELFEEGDDVKFTYEDFKNSKDINVSILYGLFDIIQDERTRIMNINSLKEPDLDDEELPF